MSMAKSLCALSVSVRNVTRLSRYVIPVRFYSLGDGTKDDQSRDAVTTSWQLHELLNSDISPPILVQNIVKHKDVFDSNHIIRALSLMHKYYKKNAVPVSEIHQSHDFAQLCKILKTHLIRLDTYQATEALKILTQLRVPSNLMIIQSLLQIIRCSINDLVLEQVYFLTFLLEKMKVTPLTQALLLALPEVFKAQVQLQLDIDDVKELSSALIYASKYADGEEIIEYILEAADGSYITYDIDSALKVFWALGGINSTSAAYRSLLSKSQEILIQDLHVHSSLDGPKIFRTLIVIADKVFEGKSWFYNSMMVHNLTNRFLECSYGLERRLIILNKLIKINHISIPLVDNLLWSIKENPDFLSTCNPFAITCIVRGASMTNYKPRCWDEIEKIVLRNYTRIEDTLNLFFLALHLASLGSFNSDMLKIAFSQFHSPELISKEALLALKKLYQCVKTLHPEYEGPWPSTSMIEHLMALQHDTEVNNEIFLPALEKIFGCPSLIKSNIQTDLGHHIDFLVILQNGIPLTVAPKSSNARGQILYVDDLDIPPDCERLAIILLHPSEYGRNAKILKATSVMNIKSLEAMSFTVVPVSMPILMESPEGERLPYLKHLIDEQIQKLGHARLENTCPQA